jgi:hypothetical protein
MMGAGGVVFVSLNYCFLTSKRTTQMLLNVPISRAMVCNADMQQISVELYPFRPESPNSIQ